MLFHVNLQAGLEDVFGQVVQQASWADQVEALSAGLVDESLTVQA